MSTAAIADAVRYQPTSYCDRVVSPAETVRRIERFLPELGITRIARQTGLDRIGIPCFAAFRPNASTLSNSQGKGLDDDGARASAVMEAAEFAVAEKPLLAVEASTVGQLRSAGRRVFECQRLLPIGQAIPDDLPLAFVEGTDVLTGEPVMVPHEAITIDATGAKLSKLNRSTNGLASGNTEDEAVFHALCELIERDATTLARARKQSAAPRLVDTVAIRSPTVRGLIARIEAAGFELWVIDQTTDLGIPSVQAIIGDPTYGYSRHFDLATGYGCHPVTERALVRAITEAAQTRVTNIAGSRDDFVPDEYGMALHTTVLDGIRNDADAASLPAGLPLGTTLAAMMSFVLQRLRLRQVKDLTMVRVGGEAYGISVVKVFAPQLEDKAPNRNWRPGQRYLRVMMGAR